MADESVREVQLTGKKLVFLGMVGAVVLVVVFLLGVMVGRGVPGSSAAEAATQTEGTPPAPASGGAPPPTSPAAGDGYTALVGSSDTKKPIEPPAAPTDAADAVAKTPPPSATVASGVTPAKAPAKDAAQAAAPAKMPATPPATTPVKPAAPAAPSSDQWFVQVNAYSKKTTADNVVASLKKKNFDAFVAHDGPLYNVKLGPFTDRAEAERVKGLLQKEGFTPYLKR
jgi:cell division septation protein DedD